MSTIHDRIAGVLRGVEGGLTLAEIARDAGDGLGERVAVGWWVNRLKEMASHGYNIGEHEDVYELVAERGVERVGGQSPDQPANTMRTHGASSPVSGESQSGVVSGDAGLITRASAAGSLSAAPRLFGDETPSAYREAA